MREIYLRRSCERFRKENFTGKQLLLGDARNVGNSSPPEGSYGQEVLVRIHHLHPDLYVQSLSRDTPHSHAVLCFLLFPLFGTHEKEVELFFFVGHFIVSVIVSLLLLSCAVGLSVVIERSEVQAEDTRFREEPARKLKGST